MAQYSEFSLKEYLLPAKSDSRSEKLRKVVFLCSVAVFILSLVQLAMFLRSQGVEKGYQQELLSYAPHLEDKPAQVTQPVQTQQGEPAPAPVETVRTVQPWAQKLLDKNKDVVGWISIPTHKDSKGNAYIDTAVVKGKTNDEYLYLNIDKKYSMSGSLFADSRCELTKDKQSDNITVYGHHMGYIGTGLTHIHEFKSGVDFLKKNPVINFNTIYDGTNQRYAIIGCFVTNAFESADNGKLFKYWEARDFKGDKKGFNEWYENVRKYSWYSSSVKCTENDDYLTLSTCSDECWGIRWVVVAKKLTASDDISKITESYAAKSDKDIYFPAVWVNKIGQKKVYYGWDY
ncbi:MAG: class B sortase [Ruminococcus sp.]|nr:class B sortase [Ruminococcus sp.]